MMQEMINNFLDNKGIEDDFIRNIVSGFINRHTKLYGDVIPFEDLMGRLNNNLNSINLIDPNNIKNDPRYHNVVGTYEGFKKKCITMFFYSGTFKKSTIKRGFYSNIITWINSLCIYN